MANKTIKLCSVSGDLDDLTLDEAIQSLTDYKETYGTAYTNLRVEDTRRDYEDGYELSLMGDRPETERERELREKWEQQRAFDQAQWRRKQYEALKKEFEA